MKTNINSIKVKRKKGLIFSICAVFLLLGIIILLSSFLIVSKATQRDTLDFANTYKFNYIEDDIIWHSYQQLLGFEIKSLSKQSEYNFVINVSELNENLSQETTMQSYKKFIEGFYSNTLNTEINLINFSNYFYFMPNNDKITIQGNMLMFEPKNHSKINKINIELDVLDNINNVSQNEPTDSGAIEINLIINHMNGDFISSKSLSADSLNNPFYIEFEEDSMLSVQLGKLDSNNGTLLINSSGIRTYVKQLAIDYVSFENDTRLKLEGGNITIHTTQNNITKTTPINIKKE